MAIYGSHISHEKVIDVTLQFVSEIWYSKCYFVIGNTNHSSVIMVLLNTVIFCQLYEVYFYAVEKENEEAHWLQDEVRRGKVILFLFRLVLRLSLFLFAYTFSIVSSQLQIVISIYQYINTPIFICLYIIFILSLMFFP